MYKYKYICISIYVCMFSCTYICSSIILNYSKLHVLQSIWQSIVVVDLPLPALLRVAMEGSDNPVSLEKPCQASLPPDQQGRQSLGRQPEVQYVA